MNEHSVNNISHNIPTIIIEKLPTSLKVPPFAIRFLKKKVSHSKFLVESLETIVIPSIFDIHIVAFMHKKKTLLYKESWLRPDFNAVIPSDETVESQGIGTVLIWAGVSLVGHYVIKAAKTAIEYYSGYPIKIPFIG